MCEGNTVPDKWSTFLPPPPDQVWREVRVRHTDGPQSYLCYVMRTVERHVCSPVVLRQAVETARPRTFLQQTDERANWEVIALRRNVSQRDLL